VDWKGVVKGRVNPPFIPKLENDYDTRYFTPYTDPIKVKEKMKEQIKEYEIDTTQPEEDESLFLNF